MEFIKSFNSYIEDSIKDNWDKDALTDYLGTTLQYHDVARKIEKLHILFENSGLKRGDKVFILGCCFLCYIDLWSCCSASSK